MADLYIHDSLKAIPVADLKRMWKQTRAGIVTNERGFRIAETQPPKTKGELVALLFQHTISPRGVLVAHTFLRQLLDTWAAENSAGTTNGLAMAIGEIEELTVYKDALVFRAERERENLDRKLRWTRLTAIAQLIREDSYAALSAETLDRFTIRPLESQYRYIEIHPTPGDHGSVTVYFPECQFSNESLSPGYLGWYSGGDRTVEHAERFHAAMELGLAIVKSANAAIETWGNATEAGNPRLAAKMAEILKEE